MASWVPDGVHILFETRPVGSVRHALQSKRILGVYDNEDAAVTDRERMGGEAMGYVVEKWNLDSEPVAPPVEADG